MKLPTELEATTAPPPSSFAEMDRLLAEERYRHIDGPPANGCGLRATRVGPGDRHERYVTERGPE
jgi:hypothetical protein